MGVREGLIPTVLGAAVTATGIAMRNGNRMSKPISDGLIGFGAAHIVLGAIDLIEHRR
ncbi:asparagine synthase [Paenibacillus turpanensis]|uniref:asparagine synthase n=1 Tax=Paenibacillus turpanensis TaxID=2689078 RepID=UPI0014080F0C